MFVLTFALHASAFELTGVACVLPTVHFRWSLRGLRSSLIDAGAIHCSHGLVGSSWKQRVAAAAAPHSR
uniref:Putative secreted protein n=1 Tax=Anopheles marajoara TaxID=58244 RepID=A0A2M4CEY5_9DIPT